MSETGQTATTDGTGDANVGLLAKFQDWPVETLTKSLALAAVLCYAAGFAITTIYSASLGLPDPSPLRPRLAYVGFIFFLLTVAPIITSAQFMRAYIRPEVPRWTLATWLIGQVIGSSIFATATRFMFNLTEEAPDNGPHHWWYWPIQISSLIAFGAAMWFANGDRAAKVKRKAWLFLLAIFALGFTFYSVVASHTFGFTKLAFWFAATSIIGGILSHALFNPDQRRKITWETTGIYVLYLLSFYPVYIYPHIKPAFAGGSLRPVRVLFTRDSSHFACTQLQTEMLDENDAGFYLRLDDQRTLFVPRTSVEALSYSQAPIPATVAKPCVPKP
jgi:hypothetical protein